MKRNLALGASPFLQSFIVPLESGAVVLARVLARAEDGEEAARVMALDAFDADSVWASPAKYPCGPSCVGYGPGFSVLAAPGGKRPGVTYWAIKGAAYDDSRLWFTLLDHAGGPVERRALTPATAAGWIERASVQLISPARYGRLIHAGKL